MRNSGQLGKTGSCEHNAHSNIITSSRSQQLASAQRQVTLRLLRGEVIPDIAGEIDSILVEKKFLWENFEQRYSNLDTYANRIERFVQSMRNEQLIFPDNMDTVIDYFGEPVTALPDFFIDRGAYIEVCKISTSRGGTNKSDVTEPSLYAIGLCGEKLFPDKHIFVELMHLAPPSASESRALERNQNGTFKYPYENDQAMVSQLEMNRSVKEYFAAVHEQEGTSACSPEECAGCPQKNVCGYEEPPISVDVEATVRPISDIRLTSAQSQIVEFDRGTARVDAGPGGGKTLVLAMRIAKLREKGIEPEEICLLTYTKAGAEEMTARAMSYAAANGVPLDPEKFTSGTFHSFCQNIINEYYTDLGYSAIPRIVPESKRAKIINDLINTFPKIPGWEYQQYSDAKFFNSRYTKSALKRASIAFETIKKEGATRDNLAGEAASYFNNYENKDLDVIFSMYEEFNRRLKRQNLCEFDDLIMNIDLLYQIHPDLFEQMGYKHILVDEFQDTDMPQIKILQKMIDTTCFVSFMAVGDDSQSIFGFRHTSPEFLINFGDYFGRFHDFSLVENHRSDKNIVDFANSVNERALVKVDKDLVPTKLAEVRPTVQGYYSRKQEFGAIADDIKTRWDAGERDIAILMSTKDELNVAASELTKRGIPSVLMCNVPYVKNSRVSALQTFYDSFKGQSTQGFVDYKNVLAHGALKGANSDQIDGVIAEFQDQIKESPKGLKTFMDFAEALDENQTDDCYQSFLEQLKFCQSIEELSDFWEDFRVYGQNSVFKREGKYEGVSLNTIHSSKGLEWDTTYLSLTTLDKLQYHSSSRNFVNSGEHDETIRKFFVGATRARKNLIMTGEYVLKMDKYGAIFNDYLKLAYETLGRAFGYTYAEYQAVKAQEKAEVSQAAATLPQVQRRTGVDTEVRAAIAAHEARQAVAAQQIAQQIMQQPEPEPQLELCIE